MSAIARAGAASLVAVIVVTLSLRVTAQDGGQTSVPTFRSSVEAVQLSVTVTDDAGRPVTDLTRDDFEIHENSQLRPVTTFAAVNIPIETTPIGSADADVLTNN